MSPPLPPTPAAGDDAGTKPAPASSWRARGVMALVATVASLGAGECALRTHERVQQRQKGADDSTWRDRVRAMNRTIYRRSDDPRLVYEPTPSSSVPMPYGPAGFNAGAMRDDRERPLDPPADRPRVAVVGDSLVWSEELPLADSLPRVLEHALEGSRAEVLNFGVTGYDTAQEAAWYERHVR
ncbi:MAG: hypothetical protein WCJ30_12005, partial [Deltaproteobacteria bacterium]